ncbi:MAG: acetyl-CoA C-acyltransferase [Anaerolineae bacterium]|nr:MAG: acetyl-CoA C-acyltransferase [Anaerolineae bacterium]
MKKRDPHYEPVIVAAKRTAVGKAKRGALASTRPDELAAAIIRALVVAAPGLNPIEIDDVIIGCAMPEGQQGLNLGRRATLRAGLPVEVPGMTVNRFCASGLQTIAQGAMSIMSGMAEVVIAGGAESMSMVPMRGWKFAPNPHFAEKFPSVYLSMGITAERVSEEFGITRADQDEFALRSHTNAARAIEHNHFSEQIAPIDVEVVEAGESGPPVVRHFTHAMDEGVRGDTTLEALGKLRPVFQDGGTVTAGNSSQMNDAAAGVLLMSRAKADSLGLKPLARFVSFGVGGVAPEVMGIGPVAAVPKALKNAGLAMEDIDLIELNEAFAAQAVAVIRELGMNLDKVNVNGGAIALGHPLGCTGAKLVTQLTHEMGRRSARFGMVTMCIGGGMGAAGIFENLQ